MTDLIDRDALDTAGRELLFLNARTHNGWQDIEVPDSLLMQIYELARWAPTSANCSPLRVIFVRSPEAKEKLRPCLAPGNVDKTMAAPACAIMAYDMRFHDHLPRLFSAYDAKAMFDKNPDMVFDTAFRNGTLQAAYFIIAARSLGLDCGPMSGFDNGKLDAAFFADSPFRSNFLCNLGYGNPDKLYPRGPRFQPEEVCTIA
ncbi:MAG: malonic semialdehyde reductase [Rhodospirillaceae bacterium]|nr:malonic semialdehyde reductase [Rhodospirillaceae bacterium]